MTIPERLQSRHEPRCHRHHANPEQSMREQHLNDTVDPGATAAAVTTTGPTRMTSP
jgi:hypothetical protein